MRWTKGKHAFIVATHIDRSHIHNHIIYNSTSLDCTRKFKNFFLSGLAVQRLSDMVCIEHGLSVIEPKPYRERVKRTTFPQKRTKRDELCAAIDQILKKKPKDFSDFVLQLSELGYEFKDGKQPAFRHSGEKRFIRLRSLGEGYSQEDIIAILSGKSVQKASRASKQVHTQREFNLLINIQAILLKPMKKEWLRLEHYRHISTTIPEPVRYMKLIESLDTAENFMNPIGKQ